MCTVSLHASLFAHAAPSTRHGSFLPVEMLVIIQGLAQALPHDAVFRLPKPLLSISACSFTFPYALGDALPLLRVCVPSVRGLVLLTPFFCVLNSAALWVSFSLSSPLPSLPPSPVSQTGFQLYVVKASFELLSFLLSISDWVYRPSGIIAVCCQTQFGWNWGLCPFSQALSAVVYP